MTRKSKTSSTMLVEITKDSLHLRANLTSDIKLWYQTLCASELHKMFVENEGLPNPEDYEMLLTGFYRSLSLMKRISQTCR